MSEPTQKISVGELKFRSMVSDLMAMESPGMLIECATSSKARSLRRMFYTWGKRIAPYEQKFLENISYSLKGRVLVVEHRATWTPKEIPHVSTSQGEPARNSGLNDSK